MSSVNLVSYYVLGSELCYLSPRHNTLITSRINLILIVIFIRPTQDNQGNTCAESQDISQESQNFMETCMALKHLIYKNAS